MGQSETGPQRCLLLFASIHHVLAAEEVFKQQGIWCDLVPVPRALSSDCGMAIEFRFDDLEPVHSLLADPRVQVRSMVRPDRDVQEESPR